MIWPFSLPSRLDDSRQLNIPIDWAYGSYKHIIRLNDEVWYDNGWFTGSELTESLTYNFAYFIIDRVFYDHRNNRWQSNGIGGRDEIFIVTNYDEGATLLKLRWA